MSVDRAARRAAISWFRSREVTPQRLWPVLRDRGGFEPLLATPEADLAERLSSRSRARAVLSGPMDSEAERWAASVESAGMRIVTAFDPEYPTRLSEIADPPFLLFAIGRLERLSPPAVAIVGSRNATRYGRDVATRLARDLSSAGVAIVSGFARGVDAAAHEAAQGTAGGTVAVLGCGLDVDYPREHARLKEAMARDELLVSEYPPGAEPRPQNFPIRNRIIAGLSAGVIVVEASRRSGSLITARLAADSGRDVFAVPGSVFSETSIGTHELLRDGAILCRNSEDVLAELFPSLPATRRAGAHARGTTIVPADLSPEASRIYSALESEEALAAEELAQSLDLPAAAVLAGLFELEGAGLVTAEGGRYALIRR